MPVAAAGLTDVGAGDPEPFVLLRGRQHPLEQLAVGGLEPGALLERPPAVGDLGGESVADRLELAETERPRLGRRRGHAGVDSEARERLGDDRRQLALQATDLAPQLSAGE